MSIMTALNNGLSGLSVNGLTMSVVGDNIANVNTVGFKSSRANFNDMLSQTVLGASTSSTQVGRGATLSDIQQLFTQGSLLSTSSPTDLAISGNGFFIVEGAHNGLDRTYFTRAGQFSLDDMGYIVNPEGLRLQGYGIDQSGDLQLDIGDINLTGENIPPNPTSAIELNLNLDANDTITAVPFDTTDPSGTSNFSTAITTYDSLGNSHRLDVYFVKTGANTWDYHALADGEGLTGGTAGVMQEVAAGTLTFTASGALDTEAQTVDNFLPLNAVNPQPLTFDFGTSITTDGGSGTDGTTQYGSASAVTFQSQDGYATGSLSSIAIDSEGLISGIFTNGQSLTMGQVAVATFQSVNGLEKVGGNLLADTTSSGPALTGSPNTGGRGAIFSNSLEQSNVDLAAEFVNLIGAQRGFQANSRTVSTADQMLGEVVNLKR